MFKQNTTFVIGAGASCELNLPSGDTLKTQILKLLKPTEDNVYGFADDNMIAAVRSRLGGEVYNHSQIVDPIKRAAQRIRRGLPLALSIDNFLHTHQHDKDVVELGKLAITISILRAERTSAFFPNRSAGTRIEAGRRPALAANLQSDDLMKSWYIPFVQFLFSQVTRDDVTSIFKNIKFIVFNYDRCLEQFLWLALQSYFDLTEAEASAVIADVVILHPYGMLGPLPWQASEFARVDLGEVDNVDLWSVSAGIQTFTESVQSTIVGQIRHSIEGSHTLLFLGFGYLDQNVLLLKPAMPKAMRMLSTAYGVSQSDQVVMKNNMGLFGSSYADSFIVPDTCRQLFEQHRLRLSLS